MTICQFHPSIWLTSSGTSGVSPYVFSAVFTSLLMTTKSFFSFFTDVAAFPEPLFCSSQVMYKFHQHTVCPVSLKVLSVGVCRDCDVDDEGGLVLNASICAVGESSNLHAVRPGLS